MRLLPAVRRETTLLLFLYFHWLSPLSARETFSGNSSIYKSTRERVNSKGLCGRWRLHLMDRWCCLLIQLNKLHNRWSTRDLQFWCVMSWLWKLLQRTMQPICASKECLFFCTSVVRFFLFVFLCFEFCFFVRRCLAYEKFVKAMFQVTACNVLA